MRESLPPSPGMPDVAVRPDYGSAGAPNPTPDMIAAAEEMGILLESLFKMEPTDYFGSLFCSEVATFIHSGVAPDEGFDPDDAVATAIEWEISQRTCASLGISSLGRSFVIGIGINVVPRMPGWIETADGRKISLFFLTYRGGTA